MKIRKLKQKSGWAGWQVDFGMMLQADGSRRRVQKAFGTQEEAKAEMAKAKAKRQAHGDSAFGLTESERIRFCAARDRLAEVGVTIEQAVEALLQTVKAVRDPLPLGQLLERCLQEKTAQLRPKSLDSLRASCLSFMRLRKEQLAHTVTRSEVQDWISGNGWSPKSQRVMLGDLRTLFSWGVTHRVLAANPATTKGADRVVLLPMEDAAIERLSVDEAKRLLRAAARVPKGKAEDFRPLLWYVVLATFAGIRPWELERMDRGAVNLDDRYVVVDGKIAKTRQRRVPDLTEEACAWLALDPLRSGPVVPSNMRKRWKRLRARAGLEKWPHDAARHTFASMHYAEHQNEAGLKAQMGHSDAEDTLMQHYRGLATRKEAAEFWAYKPSKRRKGLWALRPVR